MSFKCEKCKKIIKGNAGFHMEVIHKVTNWSAKPIETKEKEEKEEECEEYKEEEKSPQQYLYDVTEDFLQFICPDFPRIQKFIDFDIESMFSIVEDKGGIRGNGSNGTNGTGKRTGKATPKTLNSIFSVHPRLRNKIIKGFVQSKKTWMIIAISLYCLIRYNLSCFIIIENKTNARGQMENRFGEEFDKYKNRIENIKNQNAKEYLKEHFKILDMTRSKTVTNKQIEDAMTGNNPQIVIAMRSDCDMKHLNECVKKSSTKKFVLIMDEADVVDASASNSLAQKAINALKEFATVIWNVTATAMTTICQNDIVPNNLFVMTKPEGYKDLDTVEYIPLEFPAECSNTDKHDPFEKDKNLIPYLYEFSKKQPFRNVTTLFKADLPVISLIKVGLSKKAQKDIANYISARYADKITAITYNGTVITLQGNSLPKIPFLIGKKKSIYHNGIHTINGLGIGQVISWLQSQGIQKHPRIAILCGKMADRGITFCSSDYEKWMKKKQIPWHLTEMYYIIGSTTDQPSVIQSAGRLAGVYRDNVPLRMYTNKPDVIRKSHELQEELIDRAKTKEVEETALMHDIISELEISARKIPEKRPIIATKLDKKIGFTKNLNKVEDDTEFGGYGWLEPLPEEPITDENISTNKQLRALVKSYRSKKGFAFKIIDFYDNVGLKETFTKAQIEKSTGNIGNMSNYCMWDEGHSKYKILDRVGSKFRLRQEVIDELKLYE